MYDYRVFAIERGHDIIFFNFLSLNDVKSSLKESKWSKSYLI